MECCDQRQQGFSDNQMNNVTSFAKAQPQKLHQSPLTPLLLVVITFSAITGLLMGYDLCVVAVVLEPIEADFKLCPAQRHFFLDTDAPLRHLQDSQIEATPRTTWRFVSTTLPFGPCHIEAHKRKLQSESYQSCGAKQLFVAMISPGAAIGSLLAGIIADWLGRRPTLALSDILIMVGVLMMGIGQQFVTLLIGRFVLGLGIGTGFVIFSTYVSEISPDHRRGQLVSCQEVAQCLGCLSAYAVASAFGDVSWRWLFICAGTVAGIQVIGVLFLPESPRWYVSKNQLHKAENSLRRLAGLPKLLDCQKANARHHSQVDVHHVEGEYILTSVALREAEVKETMTKMILEWRLDNKPHDMDIKGMSDDDTFMIPSKRTWLRRQSTQTTADNSEETFDGSPPPIAVVQGWDPSRSPSRCSNTSKSPSFDVDVNEQASVDMRLGSDDCLPERWQVAKQVNIFPSNILQHPMPTSKNPFSAWQACIQHRKQIFLALGCALCQNLTASTAVLYYSTVIFRLAGVSNPLVAGIGIGVAKVLGILTVIVFVERIGRKAFLLTGSIGTLVSHIFLMAAMYPSFLPPSASATLAMSAMFLYMFCQNISWAGLMFVVASEVLPSSIRGIGMGMTITLFWVLAFITQSTLETLMEAITIPGTFLFYALTNFLAILFTIFFIPDLTGQSLEEIANKFSKATPNKTKESELINRNVEC